jgi:hypothetical protein
MLSFCSISESACYSGVWGIRNLEDGTVWNRGKHNTHPMPASKVSLFNRLVSEAFEFTPNTKRFLNVDGAVTLQTAALVK